MARAAALPAGDHPERTFLTRLSRLRGEFPDAPHSAVAAALEQVELAPRTQAKFPGMASLLVTREGLEQASGWVAASYQAQRLVATIRRLKPLDSPIVIVDLTSGIGGDTLALATALHNTSGGTVLAIDRDPVKTVLTALNAAAAGFTPSLSDPELAELLPRPLPVSNVKVEARTADITEILPGAKGSEMIPWAMVDAIFLDPARRIEGRRIFNPQDYQPPITIIDTLIQITPQVAVKLAPGIDYEGWALAGQNELEFISVRGELKEALLWCGQLRTCERRATLLPGGETLYEDPPDAPPVPVGPVLAWLYEPDPAVIRAHLVEELARRLDARKIDQEIAFITSDRYDETPFAHAYRVLETMPFNLKKLNTRLQALGVGCVVIKKRGSPLDPQQLEKMLHLRPNNPETMTIILTSVQGRHTAILCERFPPPTSDKRMG